MHKGLTDPRNGSFFSFYNQVFFQLFLSKQEHNSMCYFSNCCLRRFYQYVKQKHMNDFLYLAISV